MRSQEDSVSEEHPSSVLRSSSPDCEELLTTAAYCRRRSSCSIMTTEVRGGTEH